MTGTLCSCASMTSRRNTCASPSNRMPPPPRMSRSSRWTSGRTSSRDSLRTGTTRSTSCRALVSSASRENTVISTGSERRSCFTMPSRIASSPRLRPPYEPEIPTRKACLLLAIGPHAPAAWHPVDNGPSGLRFPRPRVVPPRSRRGAAPRGARREMAPRSRLSQLRRLPFRAIVKASVEEDQGRQCP